MAKTSLFDLIKSLHHGEVKHFRKAARQSPNQGDNNYLRLFDEISRQEEYDEAALKKKFRGEGLEKNFANVKRYLYKRILRFLSEREVESDARAGLERDVLEAEVLWRKGLYPQSEKGYRRVTEKARELGYFDLEMRALRMLQRDLFARKGKAGMERLEEINAQIATAMRRLRQEQELFRQSGQLFLLSRQYFAMDKPEVRAQAEQLMEMPLLKGRVEDIDFFAGKRLFLTCHGRYAQLTGNAEENARIQKQIVELWEAHPAMIRANRNQYRLELSNLLGLSGARMDFTDFPEALAKMHAIPAASRDEEGEVFQNTAFFELLYWMNTGQFNLARERLPRIERGLQEFSDKINQARLLAFRYNIMVLNLVLERFREALRQLNLILHDERTEHRQDIQRLARVFLLIFHFELGNMDLLEYLFRSAYRYFYSRGGLDAFERAILRFLRRAANLPPGPELFPAYGELLRDLNAILDDPEVRDGPGTREIVYWLRSKLEGRSLQSIVEEG